ncbi:MAG: hypothetical protein DRI65_13850 [Chloroflexota bacterium]|nr:MAG: hypothetical protein DRI65_13850 [Chloroflexota bacterium]
MWYNGVIMSRADSVGMFWEDTKGDGYLPSYSTTWKAPEFPNLSGVKVLGLDTETYDPSLMSAGPGWARNAGEVVGVSLATEDNRAWYFPIRHTVQTDMNMDPEQVFKFLNDVLGTDCIKVGANLQYDVGWLQHEGVTVRGELYDVQFAEALIDDVATSYSLDTIAQKYLGTNKVSDELYKWSKAAYGGKDDQRANIYKCPPSLVGPYAEADAHLPIQILKQQWFELNELGLKDLFKMECKLIRVLIGMRMRGVPVDMDKADVAEILIQDKITAQRKLLKEHAGFDVPVNSGKTIARMFKKHGQTFPLTESGNPSFVKDWLAANPYEGAQLVASIRKYEKAISTFIQGAIKDKAVNNVLYPSFHPLRGEFGGAVSGRFSSSKPNIQQVPSRDEELAPIIRGIFVPEKGMSWCKLDYSQIEYRFFAHYSNDKKLISQYQNRGADFHSIVGDMLGYTGSRVAIKGINFGLLYGMGKEKLIKELSNMRLDMSGEKFLKMYHDKFPAAKKTATSYSALAQRTGEIRTILNRRNTFELYEPIGGVGVPLPRVQALGRYGGGIQRAATHKALNRKLQGSSADLMKLSMVVAYEEGIFERIGYPHLTVHDEIDISYHKDYENDLNRLIEIMEGCIHLEVPVIVDKEFGTNWGNVK